MTSLLLRVKEKWEREARKDPLWIVAGYAGKCPGDLEEDSKHVVEKELIFDLSSNELSNITVLEIGCGVGRLMEVIAEHCYRVIGVDISPTMIQLAQERLADTLNAELYETSGSDLSFLPSGSVDFVYAYAVFHHNSAVVVYDYFRETFRILKQRGVFRFQVIERNSLFEVCFRNLLSGKVRIALGHFLHAFIRSDDAVVIFPNAPLGKTYTKGELKSKLVEIGFSDVTFKDCDRMEGGIWVTCRKGSISFD